MSCIIVDHTSLARAARALLNSKTELPAYTSHSLTRLHERLIAVAGVEWLDVALNKLGRIVAIVNCKAYRERYKHHTDCRYTAPRSQFVRVKYSPSREPLNMPQVKADLYQVYTTLSFISYQCVDVSESDKLKFSKFFEYLAEFENLLARALVELNPQYKLAKWS